MWVALRRVGLCGAEIRMQTWRWTVIANARSGHHWQPRRQLSAHVTCEFLFQAAAICPILSAMSYYRIIPEKNYSDVINYSVDKTVLVNLNLNEYYICPPVPYRPMYEHLRLQNGGFRH